MSKTKKAILVVHVDGNKMYIKRNKISAVRGNEKSTTIYFGGTHTTVADPLSRVLEMLCKRVK